MRDINNKHNFKDDIIEIEVGPDGEFDEKTAKFILEKAQEAAQEDIWYTHKEVVEALDKLEEENNKCLKSFIFSIYGKENFKFKC